MAAIVLGESLQAEEGDPIRIIIAALVAAPIALIVVISLVVSAKAPDPETFWEQPKSNPRSDKDHIPPCAASLDLRSSLRTDTA
jgi:hypothetical protein